MRDFKASDQDNSFLSEAQKVPKGFKMVDVVNPHDFLTSRINNNKEDCILFKGELIRAKHGFGFILNFTTTKKFVFVNLYLVIFVLQFFKKQKKNKLYILYIL